MDIFEIAVMRYVATDQSTLVIPQYDLDEAWASFDFLGINHKKERIYVIEVTCAENITALAKKVKQMFEPGQHIDRLKRQLNEEHKGEYEGWKTLVAVFIRETKVAEFRHSLSDLLQAQVLVFALENSVFPWRYWEQVKSKGWDCVPE